MNIAYINPFSIFDYTSGSSKSINLLLKNFSDIGCNVFSLCSSVSYSKAGFLNSLEIFNQSNNGSDIKFFISNNVNCYLMKTTQWERVKLNSSEKNIFYRESIALLKREKIDLIISWGNLNLEESIFKEAKKMGIKICFYLVNPSYLEKDFYLRNNSDCVITDSNSTKNLYRNFIKKEIFVLPKSPDASSFEKVSKVNNKICLAVNPSINKGIEPLILLAKRLELERPDISLWLIDGRNQFYNDLNYLGLKKKEIPKNITIFPACNDIYKLYKNVKIVLLLSIWHESGSRLFIESYAQGIPVICFDTGGNIEFIKKNKSDIFKRPDTFIDENNKLRIKTWNNNKMFSRICFLLAEQRYYEKYSKKLLSRNNYEDKKNELKNALKKLIDTLNPNK